MLAYKIIFGLWIIINDLQLIVATSSVTFPNSGVFSFTIPSNVNYLIVSVYGAQGGSTPDQGNGGKGAYLQMTVTHSFSPLATMYVTVGGQGDSFGGAGQAGPVDSNGYCPSGVGGGGGFSAIYDSNNALIVMGGGGGGGGTSA